MTNQYVGTANYPRSKGEHLSANNLDRCGNSLFCNSSEELTDVQYLHANFPLVEFASDFKADLIMGKGIKWVPDKDNEDRQSQIVLDNFLSDSNHEGVIKNQIKQTLIYGHSLIRLLEYDKKKKILPIDSLNFFIVLISTGIIGYKLPNLYIVTKDKVKEKDHYSKRYIKTDNGLNSFNDTEAMYSLLPSEVIHLKLNETGYYGQSPFLYDKLRFRLGIDTLRYNIIDISNGGVSKLLVALQEQIPAQALGLTQSEAQDPEIYQKKLLESLTKMRHEISERNNVTPRDNAVTMYNTALIKSIEKQDVNVRSIEYMQYVMSMNTELVCNALSLHPALFMTREGGSNALSIEPILDYTVNVLIAPQRVLFESQVLTRIQNFLGLKGGRLEFGALDLSNPIDLANVKEKYAIIAEKMTGIGVNTNDLYKFVDQNVLTTDTIGNERLFNSSLQNQSQLEDSIVVE